MPQRGGQIVQATLAATRGNDIGAAQAAKPAAMHKVQLKKAVAGLEGFDAQSAALVPPESTAPVQMKSATAGAELQAVQTKLNELGYACGAADGIMGPKTAGALKAFQADHGLDPSGIADDRTVAALESAKPGDAADKGETPGGGGAGSGAAKPAGAKAGGGSGPSEVTPEPDKEERPAPTPPAPKAASGGGGAEAKDESAPTSGAAGARTPASDAGEALRNAVLAQGQGAVGEKFMDQSEIDKIRAKSGLGTYTTCVDFAGKMYRDTIGALYKDNKDAMMKMATQMGNAMKMFMERQGIAGAIANLKKSVPNFDKAIDAFKQKINETNEGIAKLEGSEMPEQTKQAQVAGQQKILKIYQRELEKAEERKASFIAQHITKREAQLAKVEEAMAGKVVIAQPGLPVRPRLGEFLLQVAAVGGGYTVGNVSVSLGGGSFKHICILESMSAPDQDGVEEWVTIDGGGTHGERRVRYIRPSDLLMFNTRAQAADKNTPAKNAIGGWIDSSGLAAAIA
jgi:peptidoglycan hydrolase-like protein with peptidoglycan-binding domain